MLPTGLANIVIERPGASVAPPLLKVKGTVVEFGTDTVKLTLWGVVEQFAMVVWTLIPLWPLSARESWTFAVSGAQLLPPPPEASADGAVGKIVVIMTALPIHTRRIPYSF